MPQFPILYFLIAIFVLSFLVYFFKIKKFFYIEIFVETSINKLIKSLDLLRKYKKPPLKAHEISNIKSLFRRRF